MNQSIPRELVLMLVVGAFMLFNFLVRRAASKRQLTAEPDEALPEYIRDDIEELAWPTAVAAQAPGPPVIAATRARPPGRRFSRQALLGSRRATQDAFAVATILGRCRADEPHEPS